MSESKPKLAISVSGGRSSMFMAWNIQKHWADKYELLFVFANTGCEHPRTLEFVHLCEKAWNMPIVWLESVTNPIHGKGVSFKVVDFESASRDGAPYRGMVEKHGVPNIKRPFCTKELKTRPIFAYLRQLPGWGGEGGMGKTYHMALGIRADEPKRLKPTPGKLYPLADEWPVDKQDVLDWWEDQPFDLDLIERYGNCVWCFKKSLNKHMLNLGDAAEFYLFPAEMEMRHSTKGAGYTGEPFKMFRENRSTLDLIKLVNVIEPDERMGARAHEDAGCSESCEAF
jgi:hypothetical protein